MNVTTLFINTLAGVCLVFALIKDRTKTKQALKMAVISFFRIFPTVLAIIIIIGLLSGFVPESQISKIVGENAGFRGVLTVALLGAVLHIPSLISFPLAASLLEKGASITSVAVFITTLTMIGMVTLPLEIRTLGKSWRCLEMD